jgi:hypothetical protein
VTTEFPPSRKDQKMKAPRVYFAGKISENDWRHPLVPGLDGAICQGDNDNDLFNPHFIIPCKGFVYGGPFFVACDHGCYHGPAKHGAMNGCAGEERSIHRELLAINLARVSMADVLFAYLTSADAYGTALEIGFAHALDKPIHIGLANPELMTELWMSAHAATSVRVGSARECWDRFMAG